MKTALFISNFGVIRKFYYLTHISIKYVLTNELYKQTIIFLYLFFLWNPCVLLTQTRMQIPDKVLKANAANSS